MSIWRSVGRVFGMGASTTRARSDTLFLEYRTSNGSRRILERRQALEFVAYFRCIDILSSQIAELITGTVRVINRKTKETVSTYAADKTVSLLSDTPDGTQVGWNWVKDIATDYLVTGNALVHVERVSDAMGAGRPVPSRLSRLTVEGAQAEITDEDRGLPSVVYRARNPIRSEIELFPIRQIAHIRWTGLPPIHTANIGSGNAHRLLFSEDPLTHLSPTLITGLNANAWIQSFFDDASKNDQAIGFPTDMDEATQKKFMHHFGEAQKDKRRPVILFGGATVTQLKPTPQDADAAKLRDQAVEEVGRFYGVPATLLNQHFTQWGSGIEQLARIFWRWGGKPHVNAVLNGLSFRLLPAAQRFEVDPTAEVRGDTTALTSMAAAVKPNTNSPALMSRAETRKLFGLSGEFEDDWDWTPGAGGAGEVDNGGGDRDNRPDIDGLLGGSTDG